MFDDDFFQRHGMSKAQDALDELKDQKDLTRTKIIVDRIVKHSVKVAEALEKNLVTLNKIAEILEIHTQRLNQLENKNGNR